VKVLADGARGPKSGTRPFAKSLLCVMVQMLVPSPGTMIFLPRRIRSTIVKGRSHPMTTGIWVKP